MLSAKYRIEREQGTISWLWIKYAKLSHPHHCKSTIPEKCTIPTHKKQADKHGAFLCYK